MHQTPLERKQMLEREREVVMRLNSSLGIKPEMPYLLRKNGMWYAHNSCGYTARAELAELYTKEYAESHANVCDEVSAVPVSDVIKSAEHVQEYIDRLEAIKLALSV